MSFARYPEYKDSGVEWIGAIPRAWRVAPLLAVATERNESNNGMKENNLLSLSYGRIVNKALTSNEGLLPESFETYQIVHPHDVVMRLTDLQNDKRSLRSARVHEKGIITSAYLAVAPTGIDASFLHYLLRFYDLTKVFYSMGGGLRQSMKFSDVRRLPLLVPLAEEQQTIATFLDRETAKIDALIAEQERLIELLKEKRQAVISHAVTKGLDPNVPMKDSGVEWLGEVPAHWEVRALRTLGSVVRGASPRPAGDPRFFGGQSVPWVTVAEITKDACMELHSTSGFLTEEGAEQSRKLGSGTVIYSNSGATLGVPKILRIDACANDGVIGFQDLSDSLLPEFLYQFLSSLTETIREMVKQGSGQPNLNTDIVKALTVSLPALVEQREIVEYLHSQASRTASLVEAANQGISLLQERRSALISAAVTGQIDVRNLVEADPA